MFWILLISLVVSIIVIIILTFYLAKSRTTENNFKTENNKLLDKLDELRFFNQTILDNVPVSIVVTDKEGNVILTNSFFRKIVPWYDPDKGLNLLESERLKKAGITSKFDNVLKTGITFAQKGVMVHAPKPYYSFYLNFEVIPLKNENNEVIGALSIGQEITSLMKAKDSLSDINQKLDLEVRKRTEEFYEINDQLSEKMDFYEKKFDFLSGKIKHALSHMRIASQKFPVSEEERIWHDKLNQIFKDYLLLHQIEKKELELQLDKINLMRLLEKVFQKYSDNIVWEKLTDNAEICVDVDKVNHVLYGLYENFQEIIDQAKISIDKKGNQVNLTLEFNFNRSVVNDDKQTNFFWDVQLFLYKEIINMHKGLLKEKIDDNKITFSIKLLSAEHY